ncbi:MAG: BamA/TamA family outer membrane protein [bacterium]
MSAPNPARHDLGVHIAPPRARHTAAAAIVAAAIAGALLLAPIAHAQIAPYATNEVFLPNLYSLKRKVQWDGGREHQVVRTEHFEIVVSEADEELGLRIAGIAEPFFEELEARLHVDFNAPVTPDREKGPGRIPLIAYTSLPRFQETNTTPGFLPEGVRGFFEFTKGRIVFPHTGSNSLLAHVARHEITHAFALNISERAFEEHRTNRKLARNRRGEWSNLASHARRLARGSPPGTFAPAERSALHPKGTESGLPNIEAEQAAAEGRTLLAPRLYVGWPENADGSPDKAAFTISVQVIGAERFEALAHPATLDSLAEALRLLPDTARVLVRRVERKHAWEILGETRTILDLPAHEAAADRASLARALSEASVPAEGRWARARPELVIAPARVARSALLAESAAPLLPAYKALSAIPITVPAAAEWPPPHECTDSEEDEMFRWHGASLKPRILPLALNEGAAEFYGSDWDALEEMVLRDALLANRLPSIRDLGPQYGYLVYVGGESFLRYLSRTYGEESIALLVRSLYLGPRLSDGTRAIFGKDLDELSKDWQEDLRRAVYPAYDETAGTDDWANEISDGPFDTFPRSAEHLTLYKRARRGRTELIVHDGRDQSERVVASDRRPATESLHLLEGAQDIRGGVVAFAVQKKGRDVLRVVRLDGSAPPFDREWDEILSIGGVSIAPDGRRAALCAMNRRGHADLYIASLESGELAQITDDIYEEATPNWGARGIAFSSDRASEGSHDLFLHIPDEPNGEVLQLTHTPWNETEPSWLGDGERLVALDDRQGRRNVYFIDPVTGASGPMTRDRVGIVHADTDGERLVISTLSGLEMRVWSAPLDSVLDAASSPLVAQAANDSAPRAPSAPPLGIDAERPAGAPPLGLAERRAPARPRWSPAAAPAHTLLPYRPRYGPDILLLNATSFASGAFLGVSDLLGNRQIAFILGSNAGGSDNFFRFLNVGLVYSNLEGRNDWRVGVLRTGNDVLTEEEGFFFERNTGLLFGMTYPLDRFRSVSWSVTGSFVERDDFGGDDENYGEVSAQTILGHDTTVSDEYGYGYGGGLLTSLLLAVDYRATNPTGWGSATGLYDLRYYVPVIGRTFLATRASYGLSTGRVPQRIRLGGSWTLRGFDFNDLQGDRFALANVELRFPLPVLARVGPVPVIRAVQGALFADAGDAWFDGNDAKLKGSIGLGFRTGLVGTVLRYDITKRYDKARGGWQDGTRGDLFLGYNF